MKVGDEVIWLGDPWHPHFWFTRNQLGVVCQVDPVLLIRIGEHVRDPSFCPSIVVPVVKVEVNHDPGDEDRE